jgi:predicted NBD/HSP70 family sugar kinase
VYFAPDLQTDEHRWNGVPLEADLQEAIRTKGLSHPQTRVAVENDASALGMQEYLLQREDQDQSVAVVLMNESGEGIGGGLVINGAIAHGAGGVSGEIGHVVVEPGGILCRCGVRGCLETVAGAAAIVKRVQKVAAPPIASLKEASALAERQDKAATAVFWAAGKALGRVLSSVTAIVGSRRLVIFGPPQLTQEPDLTSARAFLAGVRRTHGHAILGVKVDIVPRVLDHATLPTAAAATAVHYFLSRPRHWIPAIARPELVGNEWGSQMHARVEAAAR